MQATPRPPKLQLTLIITTQRKKWAPNTYKAYARYQPTPKARCVVILVCRQLYLVCQYKRYATDGESFPNRISFIGVQHRRRIVHLDDGVSSRVEEGEPWSQSIHFVWPHNGPYMWVKTVRGIAAGSCLWSGYRSSEQIPLWKKVVHDLERGGPYAGWGPREARMKAGSDRELVLACPTSETELGWGWRLKKRWSRQWSSTTEYPALKIYGAHTPSQRREARVKQTEDGKLTAHALIRLLHRSCFASTRCREVPTAKGGGKCTECKALIFHCAAEYYGGKDRRKSSASIIEDYELSTKNALRLDTDTN